MDGIKNSALHIGSLLLVGFFILAPFVSAQTVDSSLNLSLRIVVLPLAPTNLSASTISQSQIDLSWTDNSNNEDGFYIEEGVGSDSVFARIDSVASGVTAYSRTGLSPSTDYFYRVQAFNDAGTSDYTNEASSTTSVAPNPPPSSRTNSANSSRRIR